MEDAADALETSAAGRLVIGSNGRRDQSALRMLHGVRKLEPVMPGLFVDGNEGCGKRRIRKGADGDDAEIRIEIALPI